MPPIDPDLRIGSVELAVSDLPRSLDFYQRILGLRPIAVGDNRAQLAADAEHATLLLSQIAAPTPAPPGSSGLFHVAWLHRTRASLADTVRRIATERWPIDGASDHGVSEALYLSDPDGLGIEIYSDRPRDQWDRPPGGQGVRMFTLPLNLEDLLAQSDARPTAAIAPDTGIGHVHLKVSDVPRSNAFYRDALGFQEQSQLPSAAFLSAGGYHHHIGLNSWQSRGGSAAPDSAPGLRRIEFELAGPAALETLERGLKDLACRPVRTSDEHTGLTVHGPDGEQLGFGAGTRAA